MPVECFELEDPMSDDTLPEGMDGWYEVYDSEETEAWVACDTTMEVER
ncbi:hypothetical protein HCTV5_33 [Halovirus HCTV-5]|nr:hypothetical protein M200_gp033 [Halovirus HCTV-5]AGM11643.1 hypothetical protein HCTV5_33 [Halovirus HCTV-5]